MKRPYEIDVRVKRKTPPPGVVVGYLRDKPYIVVVRWDDSDEVQFMPIDSIELQGESS